MANHTRGNGTVYLPKGRTIWRLQYFIHGRKVIESSGTSDEAEARRLLKVKIGEAAAGKAVPPGRATIGDLCALVIDDNRQRNLRDAAHVEWRYEAHIKPVWSRLPASRFGSAQRR